MEDLAVPVIRAALLNYIICKTSMHLLSLVKSPSDQNTLGRMTRKIYCRFNLSRVLINLQFSTLD